MLTGLLRVRNDERYVGRAIESFLPVCDQIVVLNDRSSDNTAKICAMIPRTTVLDSTYTDLNESRDKTLLLDAAMMLHPSTSHCLLFDSDELLVQSDIPLLRKLLSNPGSAFAFRILYAWNREDQIRVDGVYRNFSRGSLFRPQPGDNFQATTHGGNFHCGSVPERLVNRTISSEVRILHLGYLLAEDRIRKWKWYQSIDPNNTVEDNYKHMVIGDEEFGGLPATAITRWAGPLVLHSLDDLV